MSESLRVAYLWAASFNWYYNICMDRKNKTNELPQNAKRVFKGKIFEVWQWEQKMFDGSMEIFERIKRSGSVNVIALVGDKIILQEQEQPHREPFLSLPSGRCDKGEEMKDTAKRELLEETGYSAEEIIFWKGTNLSSSILWKSAYFIAKGCKFIQEPVLDSGEKIVNKLISFDELLMLSENEKFRDKYFMCHLMRLRLHPEEQKEFKKLLFG